MTSDTLGSVASQFTETFRNILKLTKQSMGFSEPLPMQRIQTTMLEVLRYCPTEAAALRTKICVACDIRQLWHLRCNVMQAIAAERSEAEARSLIAPITALFDEIVPSSMHSRSSPAQRRQKHIKETAQGIAG